ncbi:MAG: sugar-binding protein [Alkalibacterium sp.]|nr:sugar-binding protein [Alkalibacterium sp.]
MEKLRTGAVYGTPSLKDETDPLWKEAAEIEIDRYQTAWQGATGTGRVLWDEDNLYVRVEVTDSSIDTSSDTPWEQDSVEVFLKASSDDSSAYAEEDGHYRVNAEGQVTFGDMTDQTELESYAVENDSGYTILISVPWQAVEPDINQVIGFDLQIDDAASGSRESICGLE